MAIIYTYPTKASPAADDLILISDSADGNKTKQIKVSALPSSGAGITLTTTGTSGAATLVGTVLNIPNYATTSSGLSIFDEGSGVGLNIDKLDFIGNGVSAVVDNNDNTKVNITIPGGGGTPASPANSVQFNNAGAFGGSANLTFATNTLAVTHTVDIKGDGANAGKLKLYCENTTTPHAVTIEGPAHNNAVPYTLKLPSPAPTNNQILEYTTSGNLGWINTPASTAPQGDDGQFQYKNGSSFAGSDTLRFDSDKIHIGKGGVSPTRGQLVMYGDGSDASDIQLYNSANTRFLKLAQQAGATQDLTLTFPGVASGGNNKILESDSSGQLSWIDTPTAGAVSTYTNANNNYILTSSGTGSINGESSLSYNGSTLGLATNSTFEGSRNNADNVQTTNGIIELSNTSTSAYAYQANLDSNSKTTGANRHVIFRYDGSEIGYIRNANTNTVVYSTSASDERKKKNIVDWNDKVLDSFSLIEPKKFNYLNENDSDELTKGFIAQKMVDKFPEAYPKDPDTENELGYYSFNPSGMTVYLMKAVKELKEEVDALENRIKTLEG